MAHRKPAYWLALSCLVILSGSCTDEIAPDEAIEPFWCFEGSACPPAHTCDGHICRLACDTVDDCPKDQVCDGGQCATICEQDDQCRSDHYCRLGRCAPLYGDECTPGERQCLENDNLSTCHGSGLGCTVADWPNDTICLNKTCVVVICQAGENRCTDDTHFETCNATGTDWETGGQCETDWTCKEGACRLCTPAAERCQDTTHLQTCSEDGTAWETTACDDGQVCEEGVCRNPICTPGDPVCLSETSQGVCNALGTGFDPGDDCEADETCYRGACRTDCELALLNRSSIGCIYYAVDTNPIHQIIDEGIGGPFAVGLSNIDPGKQAHVLIEQKTGDTWAVVAGGDLTVDALALRTVVLPHRYIDASALYTGGAYRITSDWPIIAYQFNPIDGTQSMLSDASLLLPASSLDTHYLVAAWPQAPADLDTPAGWPAHIQIVASAATEVRITPSIATQAGPAIASLNPGEMSAFNLQEGDFLQLSVENHMDSFSGTIIESDEAVGVFSSNDCANVPANIDSCCCEHLEEQLFGLSSWGDTYVAARAPRRNAEPCVWQVLASEADTTVNFDAHGDVTGLPGTTVMGAGQILELQVNGSADQPGDFVVSADKPILVVQYTVGALMVSAEAKEGDPSMVQAVPVEQFLDRYVVLVPDQWVNDYFVLTRPAGVEIRVGDTPVTTTWIPVGTSDFEVGRVPATDGVWVVDGDQPFGIVVIGWDDYDSYAYPGGLNLEEINPQ